VSAAIGAPIRSSETADRAETGLAAVYSNRLHGRKTASGERYDRNALTAAHKTLPYGTRVKVTHNKKHKSVVLRINDRGPTQAGRILDLTASGQSAWYAADRHGGSHGGSGHSRGTPEEISWSAPSRKVLTTGSLHNKPSMQQLCSRLV
jgi:hypothetical protein